MLLSLKYTQNYAKMAVLAIIQVFVKCEPKSSQLKEPKT